MRYFQQNLIPSKIAMLGFSLLLSLVVLFPSILSCLALAAFAVVHHFYQNPERICPALENVVYSTCDGAVKSITKTSSATEVLVYMDLSNCHVQRVPMAGRVYDKEHRPGQFLYAWKPKMAGFNEQHITKIHTKYGTVEVIQIAGKLVRRIECWPSCGDLVLPGEGLGIIHFSSACMLKLPLSASIKVNEGDKVYAGISEIAYFEESA